MTSLMNSIKKLKNWGQNDDIVSRMLMLQRIDQAWTPATYKVSQVCQEWLILEHRDRSNPSALVGMPPPKESIWRSRIPIFLNLLYKEARREQTHQNLFHKVVLLWYQVIDNGTIRKPVHSPVCLLNIFIKILQQ